MFLLKFAAITNRDSGAILKRSGQVSVWGDTAGGAKEKRSGQICVWEDPNIYAVPYQTYTNSEVPRLEKPPKKPLFKKDLNLFN